MWPSDFNSSARAQIGGGGVPPTNSHLGTGRKWAITPRPGILPPGVTQYPLVQEAGWASGPVWTARTRCHRVSIPGMSSPWRVAVPTELSRPPCAGGAVKRSEGRGIIFHLCSAHKISQN